MSDDPEGRTLERVLERAARRVDPGPDERAALERAAGRILERTRAALDGYDVEADVVQVGSTARGTWVSGDRDVDVFVRVPTDLPREELERLGLAVGRAVLPDGREEYAEHPYVTGEVDGFDVDLVPCYDVDDPAEIRSAVDRTPFHTRYLAERLDDELAGEIRLAKGLLKGVGVYGSDLRTRGVSGYLVELLVLKYGGFRAFLEAAADWRPPVRLDPGGYGDGNEDGDGGREFDAPLVVIDPTDPERNVAAVLSETNVARTVHHARDLLAEPRTGKFDPATPAALDPAAVRTHLERRGTTPVAVRFVAPPLVDDQLYPQLERSLAGVRGALDRGGFDPVRAVVLADDAEAEAEARDDDDDGDGGPEGEEVRPAALFVECATAERPPIERHQGPPVHVGEHAAAFYRTYDDDPDVYGPFVDGERYVVEREREHPTARGLLEEGLFEVGLGARVEDALREGYDVLVGPECGVLAERPAFGRALAQYFDPEP